MSLKTVRALALVGVMGAVGPVWAQDAGEVAAVEPGTATAAPCVDEAAEAVASCVAAVAGGAVRAGYELGLRLKEAEGRAGDAFALFEAAAGAGDADAMFELGWAYENGLGVAMDLDAARDWYARGGSAGSMLALNNLGWLYANGIGVARDPDRAMELYTFAAEGGSPVAMDNLGLMLRDGIGPVLDPEAAIGWFEKSAGLGHANAMLRLGSMLLHGTGMERDEAAALDWFERADAAGEPAAKAFLGEYYEVSETGYYPERAAWFYVMALKAGDEWLASRSAGSWDDETAKAMQRLLTSAGLYSGPIDGVAGSGTRAAMRELMPGGARGN